MTVLQDQRISISRAAFAAGSGEVLSACPGTQQQLLGQKKSRTVPANATATVSAATQTHRGWEGCGKDEASAFFCSTMRFHHV